MSIVRDKSVKVPPFNEWKPKVFEFEFSINKKYTIMYGISSSHESGRPITEQEFLSGIVKILESLISVVNRDGFAESVGEHFTGVFQNKICEVCGSHYGSTNYFTCDHTNSTYE